MTERERPERFGRVRIVGEMNGFRVDFFEKTEDGLWSTIVDMEKK